MNIFLQPCSSRTVWPKQARRDCSLHRARLCGASFLILVSVVAQLMLGRFNAWAQATSPPSRAGKSPAGKVQNGKRVFAAQGCQKCHGSEGQGMSQTETENAGSRISPPSKSLSAFVGFVREPTGQMQPYSSEKVSDSELADVYAFLQSVAQPRQPDTPSAGSPSAGNALNGKSIYTGYGCYACHGRHAEGSSATGPRLSPPRLEFADFVNYVRQPTAQMPPYTDKVLSNSELADIYAFLQSLPQPRKPETIPLLK